MKKIFLILVLAFINLISAQTSFAQEGVKFYKGTWDELVVEAGKTGKPYFIDFWAPWCGPCKMLNNTTFKDKEVGEMANQNFIPYKLDIDQQGDGKMLAGTHNVSSIPTIIFFSSDGKVLGREMGYQAPDRFLLTMKKYVSEKKMKKNANGKSKGATGSGSGATFQNYQDLKSTQLEKLHADLIGTDTSVRAILLKAQELGRKKEDLLFDDLKADAQKKLSKDQLWLLDAEYYLGMKDFSKIKDLIQPLAEAKMISDHVLYYFTAQYIHLPEGTPIPHEPMRWINQLIRNQPDNLSYLDTKVALLLKDKKNAEAALLAKQIQKQKPSLNTEENNPTKIIVEVAAGNS